MVFPEVADLDEPAAAGVVLETSVRESLRRHGFPAGLLDHVSVHATCAEVVSRSFGRDVPGGVD